VAPGSHFARAVTELGIRLFSDQLSFRSNPLSIGDGRMSQTNRDLGEARFGRTARGLGKSTPGRSEGWAEHRSAGHTEAYAEENLSAICGPDVRPVSCPTASHSTGYLLRSPAPPALAGATPPLVPSRRNPPS